ncbi:metallophosphoesterase [Mycoavidus sp. B2-EB]|uniref:metallophosphoesterase n=1 Tax=Mycoavidus sp. B2-EB TaxID=2651972 RepID=UPI00162616DE|nr:metallophosphoesterase [Mycoavidus sp. B2-EB]BBO59622.1 hypothetical protein MPB2EB_0746 [Mycoavidus sp. B2-EB]
MRVFALSDLHIDYELNQQWTAQLSTYDYRDDVLILAGDVSDSLLQLEWCLKSLVSRFKKILYVPGNHDLWVIRDKSERHSLDKFNQICTLVRDCGASMQAFHEGSLSIIPLLGWYDYSFGQPDTELFSIWADFYACRWPAHFSARDITTHFVQLNEPILSHVRQTVISFSHFLPRIDLMPAYIPLDKRKLYPVLGAYALETQIRQLASKIHVYGHSHINQNITIDGISYINNAFGYPQEVRITAKQLLCVYEI